jgi:hypothetical protein
MIVSHRKKFIYFHVPRTAGSSLRELLYPYKDVSPDDYITLLPPGVDPLHINQEYARNFVSGVDNYFEFTIVREPLDRLTSMYLYGHNVKRFNSFSNFIQRMSVVNDGIYNDYPHSDIATYYKKNMAMNNFFNSQLHWTQTPLTKKIHIFKFEDITKDINDLLSHLEISPTKLYHRNKVCQSLKNSLSSKEIDFCRNFLKKEYEVLNYN